MIVAGTGLRRFLCPAALLAVTGALGGCWVNPATGRAELSLIGESDEIRLGQEYDRQIVESFGLVADEALQRYVSEVGQRVASASNRPDLPWTFRVLDDPEVNAFALPGGFVYVTRGLLVHLEREDALAAVLAHEVGHVAARHSVNQVSRAAIAGSGVGLISIVSPRVGQRASARLELSFLAHSREDEMEADDLGVRYARGAGYDAGALLDVLAMLGEHERLSGADQVPTHLSTHPDPDIRLTRLEPSLGKRRNMAADAPPRAEFFARTVDLLYGEDARQGFVVEQRWVFPAGGVELTMPPGWKVERGKGLALGAAPSEDAVIVVRRGEQDSAEAAERELISGGGVTLGPAWEVQLGGWPTRARYFELAEDPPRFRGLYAFVEQGESVWELVALTTVQRLEELAPSLQGAMASFAPLREPRLLALQPRRVKVRQLTRAASLRALASEDPPSLDLDHLALINRVDADAVLPAGSTVRWVVGFDPEAYRQSPPAQDPPAAQG